MFLGVASFPTMEAWTTTWLQPESLNQLPLDCHQYNQLRGSFFYGPSFLLSSPGHTHIPSLGVLSCALSAHKTSMLLGWESPACCLGLGRPNSRMLARPPSVSPSSIIWSAGRFHGLHDPQVRPPCAPRPVSVPKASLPAWEDPFRIGPLWGSAVGASSHPISPGPLALLMFRVTLP